MTGTTGRIAVKVNGKNHTGLVVLCAGVLALAALGAWKRHRIAERGATTQGGVRLASADLRSPSPRPSPLEEGGPLSAQTNTGVFRDAVAGKLQDLLTEVKSAPDAKAARQRLAALHAALSAMPTNEAATAIRQLLDSHVDGSTHLGFKVASNGLLEAAPTLRTFLLDELARIDPMAAAQYARTVLGSKDSPDEWALALRNLARGDSSSDGRVLLEHKTDELLHQESWQTNPSAGYLEAFDVAVYLGATNLMPALSDLVRRHDNAAVSHAAFLALDRMVINDPATILGALEADPALMQGREATRANYFARADVRDSQQRQVLESYLLNSQISPAELETFAGGYPSPLGAARVFSIPSPSARFRPVLSASPPRRSSRPSESR